MEHFAPINAISEAIQLSVAPVFLLTGIGAILSVLANRFGRVVDRLRRVESRMARVKSEENRNRLLSETNALWSRIKVINWAMRLAVSSALLICVVVMSLFIGDFGDIDMGKVLTFLFIAALLLLILSLLLFLIEVSISTGKMLQSVEHIITDDDGP
jgi:Protein of unknown function (DUF2721)